MLDAKEARKIADENLEKHHQVIIPALMIDINKEITKAVKAGLTSTYYEITIGNCVYYDEIKAKLKELGYKVGHLKQHPFYNMKLFDIRW